MPTSAFAAVTPISEKLRCEHAETRNRISIGGSLPTDRNAVAIHDLVEEWMTWRKPVTKRNLNAIGPQWNSLHFPNEFEKCPVRITMPTREAHVGSDSGIEKILGSDTLTAHHIRLSYGYFCEGGHTRGLIGAGGHINCETDFRFTGQTSPSTSRLTRGKIVKSLRQSRRRPGVLLGAVAVSFGLIVAACGSGDGGGTTDTTATDESTPTDTAEVIDPLTAVTPGGDLVMAIEADTSSPWRPSEMVCAISCHQIARTVYDTLMIPGSDNVPVPYLASSVEPNEDFTVWRITARSGVTFHDGTNFDAAAIV
ncbi:MAG: hypothetical protein RLZ37_1677, partial [Actinomycetota bacterium]